MRIAEVAKKYDISADTLRYYEKEGLIAHVGRTASGIRDYDEQACASIEFVKCMRGANVSIEALARYMKLLEQGDETAAERKAILVEQREEALEKLAQLQAGIDKLDHKIANYDQIIAKAERGLQKPQGAAK